jgi:hypothetical protein
LKGFEGFEGFEGLKRVERVEVVDLNLLKIIIRNLVREDILKHRNLKQNKQEKLSKT